MYWANRPTHNNCIGLYLGLKLDNWSDREPSLHPPTTPPTPNPSKLAKNVLNVLTCDNFSLFNDYGSIL